MLNKPHKSHSQSWESSPKDMERRGFGVEGSRKEESYDKKMQRQGMLPKMPKPLK